MTAGQVALLIAVVVLVTFLLLLVFSPPSVGQVATETGGTSFHAPSLPYCLVPR